MLEHDANGFLTGTRVDNQDATRTLTAIHNDTSAIRRLLARQYGQIATAQIQRQSRPAANGAFAKANHALMPTRPMPQGSRTTTQNTRLQTATQHASAPSIGQEQRPRVTENPNKSGQPPKHSRRQEHAKRQYEPLHSNTAASRTPRDKQGRFVAQGMNNDTDSPALEKSQRLMTEMTNAIKHMGSQLMQGNDELDPLIAGSGEVARFLGAGKEAITPLGRGMAQVFNKQERTQVGWFSRIWQALTKGQTTQSEFSKAELKHLKAIENKPVSHAVTAGLPSLSGMGGLATGGLKLLSKIPRIGKIAALAGLAFGAFANDGQADEADRPINQSKKAAGLMGGVVGGGAGTWAGAAAGAAIGSVIPVVGTTIGGIVGGVAGYFAGDSAGELIGHWLADVNWRDVGDSVSSTWQNATSNMSKVWDSAVASFTGAFGEWFKQAGQLAEKANQGIKEWTGVDVKVMASTASSYLGNLVDQVKQGYWNITGQNASTAKQGKAAGASSGGVKDYGAFLAGNLSGYSTEETRAFMNRMIHKENRGGQLDLQNKWGYTGLYQFGASALAQTGMIDRRKFDAAVAQNKGIANGSDIKAHKAFLADPSNWTIAGGLSAYRNSKALQDESMRRLVEANIKSGKKYHKGNKAAALGYAAAAHIGGAGRANKWYGQGIDSVDGNKTKTSSYAAWGEAALQGVGQGQAPINIMSHRSSPAKTNGQAIGNGFAFTQASRGIGYNATGHGSLAAGAVDCSQWVYELQTAVVDDMNRALGTKFDPKLLKKASTAAGQIQAVQKATGQMWANGDINETLLKEGMLLGTSNGKNNQRFKNIDHIAQVTIDAVGKRWISESHGGKNGGVHQYAADQWLARQRKQGRTMYAVDPYWQGRQHATDQVHSPTLTTGSIGVALGQTVGSTVNASVSTAQARPRASIHVPKDIHEWLAQSGKKASSFDNAMKLNQVKPAPVVAPAFEMPLTQDVSDRDIARIVTGGIGGLAMKN